jgi:hypothetical protein
MGSRLFPSSSNLQFFLGNFGLSIWRSGRVVKAFDSNYSYVLVSNPFGGKSSNLLGVDIFFCSSCAYGRDLFGSGWVGRG